MNSAIRIVSVDSIIYIIFSIFQTDTIQSEIPFKKFHDWVVGIDIQQLLCQNRKDLHRPWVNKCINQLSYPSFLCCCCCCWVLVRHTLPPPALTPHCPRTLTLSSNHITLDATAATDKHELQPQTRFISSATPLSSRTPQRVWNTCYLSCRKHALATILRTIDAARCEATQIW